MLASVDVCDLEQIGTSELCEVIVDCGVWYGVVGPRDERDREPCGMVESCRVGTGEGCGRNGGCGRMVVLVIDWSSGVKLSSRSSSSVSGGSDMDTTGSPGFGSLIRASSFELIFLTSLAVSWSTLRYWIQHMFIQSSPNSVLSWMA